MPSVSSFSALGKRMNVTNTRDDLQICTYIMFGWLPNTHTQTHEPCFRNFGSKGKTCEKDDSSQQGGAGSPMINAKVGKTFVVSSLSGGVAGD